MGVACCCSAAVLKTSAIFFLSPTVAMSTAVTPFWIMHIILSGNNNIQWRRKMNFSRGALITEGKPV